MYNSHFGFRENPFSVTPDPRFFYANPLYQEAFAALQYGIKNKKGFIVITGEVGTGKTTLLRKLMRHLEATIDSVFIFNTSLSFSEILQLILQDLGLPHKGTPRLAMMQELNEYLIQQLQKNRTVSLLIDEAQNLNDESLEGLRLLSNLETDKDKLLQIVLMGQPELEGKLNKHSLRQLNQRVALRCRLAPLSRADVAPYLRHRLRVAGYNGPELFSEQAVKAVWGHSRGTPRLINLICDNALLTAYATHKRFVSLAMVEEAARDLGLQKAPIDLREVVSTPNRIVRHKGQRAPAVVNRSLQPRPRRLTRIAVGASGGALAALLFAVGVTFVMDPAQTKRVFSNLSVKTSEDLRGIAGRRLKFFEDRFLSKQAVQEEVPAPVELRPTPGAQGPAPSKPNVLPVKLTEPIPEPPSRNNSPGEQANATTLPSHPLPVKSKVVDDWKTQPIVIEYGSTISQIAGGAYGDNKILALDLLKEFNSHIENLNWVIAGQSLWLPPLSRETLLRQQPDGSYHLILGSFPSSMGAERHSRLARNKGYEVLVTPRRVSDNILLYRVEIKDLKNLAAVNQAWNTAVANTWFSLPGNYFAGQSGANHNNAQDH